jgi:hypothetical protein
MKLNNKQVAIIWISLTIWIPVIYFALTATSALQRKEAFWLSAKPTEEVLIQRVDILRERKALFNKFGVFSFGLLSFTGLLVFLNRKNKD